MQDEPDAVLPEGTEPTKTRRLVKRTRDDRAEVPTGQRGMRDSLVWLSVHWTGTHQMHLNAIMSS